MLPASRQLTHICAQELSSLWLLRIDGPYSQHWIPFPLVYQHNGRSSKSAVSYMVKFSFSTNLISMQKKLQFLKILKQLMPHIALFSIDLPLNKAPYTLFSPSFSISPSTTSNQVFSLTIPPKCFCPKLAVTFS